MSQKISAKSNNPTKIQQPDYDSPSHDKTIDDGRSGLASQMQSGILIDDKLEMKVNDIVFEAVSHGLSHFGGENVVESLLYILELDHSLDLRNIGQNLKALEVGLDKMFGNASYVVREQIGADLAKKLGLDPSGRTLEDLVGEARLNLTKLEKDPLP